MRRHHKIKFSMLLSTSVMCWILVLVMIVYAHGATVELTWSANTESDLAGYKLYSGTAAGQYGTPVDVGKSTAYQMTITPSVGATYYFALTAYDTSGNESEKSAEVSVFIPDANAPAEPKGFMQRLIAWLKKTLCFA